MDFVQGLDPSKLVTIGAGLSFFLTLFGSSPTYNLPLLLFGVYTQENSDAIQSLKLFTALLGGSVVWDIIWVFKHEMHFIAKMSLLLLLLLKVPTFFAFATSMRQRGAHFSGLGAGETVWSMPGGFTSGGNDGYQPFGDSAPVGAPPPPPATRTGGPPQAPPVNGPQAPGAYQSV